MELRPASLALVLAVAVAKAVLPPAGAARAAPPPEETSPATDAAADEDKAPGDERESSTEASAAPPDDSAAPEIEAGTGLAADEAPAEPPGRNMIDAGHAYASAGVRGLATWIDGFFTEQRYEAELNQSWARLRLDSFSELYAGTEGDAKVRLHLKLPGLHERLRFEVLSSGEAEEETAAAGGAAAPQPPESVLERVTTALTYFFRNDDVRSVSARIGVDYDGFDPEPFIGGRYRGVVELSENLDFHFVQRLRYYEERGGESRTVLGLDRALPDDMLFRWEVDGTWLEEDPNYFYGVNFSLFQPLDDRSAVQYQVLNLMRTDPHRLDRSTIRVRYRRQVWRDWLVFEAAPQLVMTRDRDYGAVPGFLFRVEVTFGRES